MSLLSPFINNNINIFLFRSSGISILWSHLVKSESIIWIFYLLVTFLPESRPCQLINCFLFPIVLVLSHLIDIFLEFVNLHFWFLGELIFAFCKIISSSSSSVALIKRRDFLMGTQINVINLQKGSESFTWSEF